MDNKYKIALKKLAEEYEILIWGEYSHDVSTENLSKLLGLSIDDTKEIFDRE